MKKIKLFLYVVVASVFAAACDDAIDITQPSELPPDKAFETVEDLQKGILAVYPSVPGENVIYFTSLFTDEVKLGRQNGGQGQSGELAFLLNATSNDAASIWLSYYRLINRANRLLEGAAKITPVVDEEAGIDETPDYDKVIAEAKFFRAYAHFQLVSFFSTDMKDDAAPGVIIMDHVPGLYENLPRNTNGEVFAFINQDLDEAEPALPTGKLGASGFLDVKTVYFLRARMAAYRGQYTVAENIIDTQFPATGSASYALATKGTVNLGNVATLNNSNYFKMFRDATGGTTEVVFKVVRAVAATDITGNFYQYWSNVNSSTTGGAFFEVGTALYTKYNPDDIRRAVVIDPSAYPGYTVRPVGKYAESKSVPLQGDLKLFRMSELVLIKAECRAAAGDFAGVATEINRLRTVRFGNATGNIAAPGDAAAAWGAILDERRLELAFEGFRYLDIKRLGQLAGKGIDRAQSDFLFNEAFDLPLDDHRWTLPIPISEITANPNIQQNPGY